MILLPWIFVWLSSGSVGNTTLIVLKRMKISMVVNLLGLFTKVSIALACGLWFDWSFMIRLLGLTFFVFQLVPMLFAVRLVRVRISHVMPLNTAICLAAIGLVGLMFHSVLPDGWVLLAIGTVWFGITGAAMMGLHRRLGNFLGTSR